MATGWSVQPSLLKGPLTIVASPDGRCLASNTGDHRLATAGTGDVLAGLIGSFLAAGIDAIEAAALAAWIHGAAGSMQAEFGMVASDLLDGLPATVARLAQPSISTATQGNHAPY